MRDAVIFQRPMMIQGHTRIDLRYKVYLEKTVLSDTF